MVILYLCTLTSVYYNHKCFSLCLCTALSALVKRMPINHLKFICINNLLKNICERHWPLGGSLLYVVFHVMHENIENIMYADLQCSQCRCLNLTYHDEPCFSEENELWQKQSKEKEERKWAKQVWILNLNKKIKYLWPTKQLEHACYLFYVQ